MRTSQMPRFISMFILILLLAPLAAKAQRPPEFVNLESIAPSILIDMRYSSAHNFVGRPIEGYTRPICILTRPAAQALADAQQELQSLGLGLKVYDCYRPKRAVLDFVAWAASDTTGLAGFYPRVAKGDLFKEGYIAERSGHSRGSTIDLTLVPYPKPFLPDPSETVPRDCRSRHYPIPDNSLDMGTSFDCFDPLAHTDTTELPPIIKANRALLKTIMQHHGFKNLPQEWWHYTLENEPFPSTYFDFPID